ncbi:MAG: diaminopimelate epimerase [Lentisphaeria bacterium]
MKLRKYHGLGNDYIVLHPDELTAPLDQASICQLCQRNLGVGSDGILLGPFFPGSADFSQITAVAKLSDEQVVNSLAALRIYNPDGSEAEKSGNGLRIFSRFLFDIGLVDKAPFRLNTLGGQVEARIFDPRNKIQVDMGSVSFLSRDIPVAGQLREVLQEKITLKGREFTFCAAGIGNPHCIVLCSEIDQELAREFGPLLETHPLFPHKTNVQFLKVLDRHQVAIEIWERGAGYTLASGSSACACAASVCKLGLCDSPITVHMPGGELFVSIDDDYQLTQTGPVQFVFQGDWLPE